MNDRTRTKIDVREEILPSVVLAPSAHNAQPWQFQIGDDYLDIYVDWDRHLAVSDPTRRQTFVSLGCAITNTLVAAAGSGYQTVYTYFPKGEGKDAPAIRIWFQSGGGARPDEHLARLKPAIEKRRTYRDLFDKTPLTPDSESALRSAKNRNVLLIENRQQIKTLGDLTEQGTLSTLANPAFKDELSHWVRNSWTKQPDGMPGYAMGMPAPISLVSPLMVRVAPIHKQEGPKTRQQVETSSAVAVIATENDIPIDWMAAGQLLEQLWLEATTAGLAASVMTAAIEAGKKTRRAVRELMDTNHYPQTILRIGRSDSQPRATPRRSIADCLIDR